MFGYLGNLSDGWWWLTRLGGLQDIGRMPMPRGRGQRDGTQQPAAKALMRAMSAMRWAKVGAMTRHVGFVQTDPQARLRKQSNAAPMSAKATGLMVGVGEVAPETGPPLTMFTPSLRHWHVIGPVPVAVTVAVTENEALCPLWTAARAGC